MPFKTIKIKDDTYENINVIIGELRKEFKRPVSVDEALKYLMRMKNSRKTRPSKFAGSWKMDDKEAEAIKKDLKESWKTWEL